MHTKRIAAGKGKKPKWVVTVKPGSHSKKSSMTLLYVVRDLLGYADNAREAKKIINDGLILVDKKPRREVNGPVGLMDVIEAPKLKKAYRVLPSKYGLQLKEIPSKEASIKPCRIMDKNSLSKGRVQLSLHDGSTLVINKDTFKTKDTLVLELPSKKISDVLEFKKGATALVYHGRHAGETGVIQEVIEGTQARKSTTKLGEIETLTDYVFIVGKDKAVIST